LPAQLVILGLYEDLLRDEAIPRGMVAASDRDDLHTRHVLDSLRAVPHLAVTAEHVLDLGSGAGLPGVPVAVARPDLDVTLAEPRRARAAFLELTIERLLLPNVRVFAGPAGELDAGFDVCLARGFGDVGRTWTVASGLLNPSGQVIYWAGRTFRPDEAPPGVRVRTVASATLESGGPIAIMTRE
jgi:16S rRNA (guanine527-N7)-methyltransferase